MPRPLKDPKWAQLASSHSELIMQEFEESRPEDQERMKAVLVRMQDEVSPDFGSRIDWDGELAEFADLPYPSYYTLPFHSVAGGWLSREAALMNRQAMQAIYVDSHVDKCLGVYNELAKYVPESAQVVVDVGTGIGDGAAAIASRLPCAKVIALDASPFMIIVGRRVHRSVPSLQWKHCLAENTGFPDGMCDCVAITLVFHECSDDGKHAIIREAFRILRVGGTLVFSDTPPVNLQTYRGFHEPWKDQWLAFDVDAFLSSAGFVNIQAFDVTGERVPGREETRERLFTRVAQKPSTSASKL